MTAAEEIKQGAMSRALKAMVSLVQTHPDPMFAMNTINAVQMDYRNALDKTAALAGSAVSVYSATLERAKRMIEERMHAHMHAHGCYDSSTNAWEYQGGQSHHNMAWEEGMQEALDIIEALLKGEK